VDQIQIIAREQIMRPRRLGMLRLLGGLDFRFGAASEIGELVVRHRHPLFSGKAGRKRASSRSGSEPKPLFNMG